MAGDIFYSQVDTNLQKELNARAIAGSIKKGKPELDFMIGKMTNVRITAFNDPKLTNQSLAKNKNNEASKFAILGGATVRSGDYIPKFGKSLGYLDRPANRIPPVFTLCNINIGDNSMGLLNRASLSILISDPSADLDEFEEIWFRPGRHCLIEIEGNKEQIITRSDKSMRESKTSNNEDTSETAGLLTQPNSRTYEILAEKFGADFIEARAQQVRHMNKILFDGVVTSFTFSYQSDGTIDVSLQLSGTSNVYTDVELLLPKNDTGDLLEKDPKKQEEADAESASNKGSSREVNTLLKFIKNTVETEVKEHHQNMVGDKNNTKLTPQYCFHSKYGGQSEGTKFPDKSILVGQLYNHIPEASTVPEPPPVELKVKPKLKTYGDIFTEEEIAEKNNRILNLGRELETTQPLITPNTPLPESEQDPAVLEALKEYEASEATVSPPPPPPPSSLPPQFRYIQLGLLIDMINREIISKMTKKPKTPGSTPTLDPSTTQIICNPEVCKSSIPLNLVSSNPKEILLYGNMVPEAGAAFYRYPDTAVTMSIPPEVTDETPEGSEPLGDEIKIYQPEQLMPKIQLLGTNTAPSNKFYTSDPVDTSTGLAHPSRIYIEIDNVIAPILNKTETIKTVNDFLKAISKKIHHCTGGAISMTLIEHPEISGQRLFYDRNFLGSPAALREVSAKPYIVPMGAKSSLTGPNSLGGTIITDLKLTSKLPSDLQSLSFVLNEGSEISSQAISPFVTFMYAQGSLKDEGSQKFKIAEAYKKSHIKYKAELEEAKALLTNDYNNFENNVRLQRALEKFLKYPTDDITLSNLLSAPIYPFDAELTIEGISGFRYGDVVILPLLPERYKTQTVFSVIGIDHTIDSSGVWSTKLKLIMRPKIT